MNFKIDYERANSVFEYLINCFEYLINSLIISMLAAFFFGTMMVFFRIFNPSSIVARMATVEIIVLMFMSAFFIQLVGFINFIKSAERFGSDTKKFRIKIKGGGKNGQGHRRGSSYTRAA